VAIRTGEGGDGGVWRHGDPPFRRAVSHTDAVALATCVAFVIRGGEVAQRLFEVAGPADQPCKLAIWLDYIAEAVGLNKPEPPAKSKDEEAAGE
jgi:hypothetical protein